MRVLFAFLTLLAAVIGGCAHTPDTTLNPSPAPAYAPLKHPFQGAKLFHDTESTAASWRAAHGAAWLEPITGTPQAIWLTSPQDLGRLPAVARKATAQKALLVLVAYYIPDRGCTNHQDGAPDGDAYLAWIDQLLSRLEPTKAAIIMEPDALPADCFNAERAKLLKAAVGKLAGGGHFVYLDAGHPRWKSAGETAERLLLSGIQQAEGFSINVSNRQTTKDSHQWGLELSNLVGDREFVIDTSRNGLGQPPDDPARDDEWCNPAQQALGDRPTTDPQLPRAAALLWIKRPGESDGLCGGENTYQFAPAQARNLIVNAAWVPQRLRDQAAAAPL